MTVPQWCIAVSKRQTVTRLESLAIRIAEGEPLSDAEYDDWYWETDSIIRACLKRMRLHDQLMDDATSRTIEKAWRYRYSYNPRYPYSSWLWRMAHNIGKEEITKSQNHYSRHDFAPPDIMGKHEQDSYMDGLQDLDDEMPLSDDDRQWIMDHPEEYLREMGYGPDTTKEAAE